MRSLKMPNRPLATLFAAALVLLLLAGCSPLAVLNTFAPTSDLDILRDVAYGTHSRAKLDVYRKRQGEGAPPIVVFFYGGSWEDGRKENYLFLAEALASRGFVAVVPDYRVYPEVRFPAFLEDAAQAIAWTKRNAREIGGDPGKIFLMGHSAGAHIAAMEALDPQYLAREGLSQKDVSGFIGLAGPYDFLPLSSETLKKIFAPEETIARTQPINFASAASPPALLVTGEKDSAVSPRNTQRLAARLREMGVAVTELRYPDYNHYNIIGVLSAPLRSGEPLLDEIEHFVRSR